MAKINILDILKMSEPALDTRAPEAERQMPAVEDVRDAIANFLTKMVGAKKVNLTKLALEDSEKETWEAEAEAYVPNATIIALGLPVTREVLDCEMYLFRLDKGLNIIAYGLRDSVLMERESLEF